MPTIAVSTVLAIGAAGINPLSGSQFEFPSYPFHLEIGLATDATGVVAFIAVGPEIIQEAGPIRLRVINTPPVYPDDFIFDDAMPGDRAKIALTNNSGAQRTVMTELRISPLA